MNEEDVGGLIKWGGENDRPHIKFRETVDLGDVRWRSHLMDTLNMPESLRDTRTLELFSGGWQDSFRGLVEGRGGMYQSVDASPETVNGPGHVTSDAYEWVKGLEESSFDYCLIKGPPVWGRWTDAASGNVSYGGIFSRTPENHDFRDGEKLIGLLARLTESAKPQKGNFVALMAGCTQRDVDFIIRQMYQHMRQSDWVIYTPKLPTWVQKPLMNWRGAPKRGADGMVKMEDHRARLVKIERK